MPRRSSRYPDCAQKSRGREDRRHQDGDARSRPTPRGAGARARFRRPRRSRREADRYSAGRRRAVDDPVREAAVEAQQDGERAETDRARRARLVERAVDRHQEQRVRHRDGALHPETPDGLAGREGPGRRPRRRREVREAPAPEEGVRGEEGEVELQKQDARLDAGLRQEEAGSATNGERKPCARWNGPIAPDETHGFQKRSVREAAGTGRGSSRRTRRDPRAADFRTRARRAAQCARGGARGRSRATRRRRRSTAGERRG